MFRAMLRYFPLVIAALLVSAEARAEAEPSLSMIVDEWTNSAHADATAEAFIHWNAEGEVPARCALCHAGAGFRDFHGLDGSAVGSIDATLATGGVVDCDTCHAKGAMEISEVTFPSGMTLAAAPGTGTCLTCHQGRSSGVTVAASFGGGAVDEVNAELSFLNPHYALAAATNFGGEAKGLFEYEGQSYVGRFTHGPGPDTCTACHSPHSLEVAVETCVTCHATEDTTAIRTSTVDFDGDGDTSEGIVAEIEALRLVLAEGITEYAREVAGTAIVYDGSAYPYFFADLNGNGLPDPEEANRDNAYAAWTPRLLAAAYNFQFVTKDPGAYVHNPSYALQALHDSIVDLASATDWTPGPMARP